MKKYYLTIALFTALSIQSQVGIGTTTPAGALDITSTTNGVLVPRIALTSKAVSAPVVNPQGGGLTAGTLVWNTATAGTPPNNVVPGFYYWNGTAWIELGVAGNSNAWNLTGNAGTNPATNFLGSTDNVEVRVRTNNAERFTFTNNGRLRAYDNGTTALPTYSWAGDDNTGFWRPAADVLGFSTAGTERFRIPNANQVHAMSLGTAALPFYSFSADTNTGIFSPGADNLAVSTTGTERMRFHSNGQIVVNSTAAPAAGDLFSARTSGTNNYAINGYNTLATGSAIYAQNSNAANTYSALEATTNASAGAGVFGISTGATAGVGVLGEYRGTAFSGLRIGVRGYSGAGFGNQQIGVQGSYNDLAWGIGLMGIGYGGAVPAGNNDFAVVGWSGNNLNFSGYFNGNHVIANGTKSASVGTSKGNQLLYVTESPEVWFEDVGRAKLVNGVVEVKLDPLYAETIFVDESHPMSVFLQEEGDSNGLYVIPGQDGFTVREKGNGTSNISFSYRIMAKRKHFQDHRFGNDPVWGPGDTRHMNEYAPPPPVDYSENVQFQADRKKNYKPAALPAGFKNHGQTRADFNSSARSTDGK